MWKFNKLKKIFLLIYDWLDPIELTIKIGYMIQIFNSFNLLTQQVKR